jgi:CRP-like cAMP-binding protein
MELGIEARFEPGAFLFQEHDQEQSYYITSGSVALEQPGPDHPARVQTFREGGFLGWAEFLGSATRHFQARALTPVAAIAFDRGLLRKGSECNPHLGYALMKHFLL